MKRPAPDAQREAEAENARPTCRHGFNAEAAAMAASRAFLSRDYMAWRIRGAAGHI